MQKIFWMTKKVARKIWWNFLVNHTRKVSKSFIWILGTTLSLDKMMIRFSGKSAETHRVKNKPINEGYKLFVLATKSGYVVNFCLAMDNYFTLPKVIHKLRQMEIGVVGTARFRAGNWPPKELKDAGSNAKSNDFYSTVDEFGTLLICSRTWVPIFVQILSIIRNNSHLIHRETTRENVLSHKALTLGFITWFMDQAADAHGFKPLEGDDMELLPPRAAKQSCMDSPKPGDDALNELFPNLLKRPIDLHCSALVKTPRRTCVYCSAVFADRKKLGEDLSFQKNCKRTFYHCSYCSIGSEQTSFLCKDRFETFHSR
mmetsp:Transcript_17478/g.39451  ORF Transcript_17478/g.39451 Transcript_17478/m.39451 type:complete len:315 (-) Transcript_17478:15-959(-)